jgi:serine/threonine-protein kinase
VLLRNVPAGWEPVIIDLGIAKWLAHEAATATGSVFGTPHYMSPEQFRDTKHVGPATDRYALAVIGFELLSGDLPYDGRSLPELLHQHMEAEIPPLRVPVNLARAGGQGRTRATSPLTGETRGAPKLDAFMRKAMAKLPRDRYDSGREMAEAFQQAATTDALWDPPSDVASLFDPLARSFLEIRRGTEPVQHYDLREGPIAIGRHEACQYILASPRMSRLHACIYTHRGRVWISDLQSQNGTKVDGRALTPGVPVPMRVDGEPTTVTLYDQELTAVATLS